MSNDSSNELKELNKKMDEALSMIREVKTHLFGVEGKGGMHQWLHDVDTRVRALETSGRLGDVEQLILNKTNEIERTCQKENALLREELASIRAKAIGISVGASSILGFLTFLAGWALWGR